MQKKGELSRLAVNLLIGSLIIIVFVILAFFIFKNINDIQKGNVLVKDLDLKISQVKKVDDKNMEITVQRNEGEGQFNSLSFIVDDGSNVEVIKKETSMGEGTSETISLNFILINASRVKRISITPIFIKGNGEEIVGEVEDEYVTPNTCSNYCPVGAQCGYNDCGMLCGNGCASGYLCLSYKCIKEKTSSGGGSSGGSSSSGDDEDNQENETVCTPTTCLALQRTCGTVSDGCGGTLNCGSCSVDYSCAVNGTCMKNSLDCIASTTCSSFGKNCGTISNGCSGSLNCGTCSTGYTCFNNICIDSDDLNDENIQQQNSDCGDILDYQCGTRTICDKSVNFGNCPMGYSCNNNLCVAKDDLSCTGITCPSGEYCSHGVCLLDVSGNTYFVATWGNDDNPGTFTEPFYSWQKAVEVSQPGDITYIRGGLWQPNSHILANGVEVANIAMLIDPIGYRVGASGTANAPIRYYNYPGETPILDGSLVKPNSNGWIGGIGIDYAEHIYLRGLTIRNIHQTPPDFTRENKPYSEAFGIGSAGANLYYENMIVHDIDGRGFAHWSQAWNEWDGEDTPFEYDNTSWINCDSYNIFDRYSLEPGNAGDAWKVQGYYGNYFTWIGCRAFNYSDDGFDPSGQPYRLFKNCWAMASNRYIGLGSWGIEGNGYKATGVDEPMVPNYEVGKEHFSRFENCLAVECNGPGGGVGFYNNILVDYDGVMPNGGLLYNNFAYKNGIGYSDANASIFRNNIVYNSQQTESTGKPYEVYLYEVFVDTIANTWISTGHINSDWWWGYNPDYTVTDEDFVSLDASQLMRPRKLDGSLPDITFGHLAQGSDLINTGVVIPGYHCSTPGSYSGEDCVEWFGSAPDLGPFESNY